jgi:hypothetical protein
MFKITIDDLVLWSPFNNVKKLESPTLSLEVNKLGSLSFKIYPDHPYYSQLIKMKSVITVYQDHRTIFKGRIFSDKVDFKKVKKVEAEGILGYFNDSVVRPYEFTGTPVEYLDFLIDQHNSQVSDFQKFKRGNVTVTDPNDYITRANSNAPKTWNEIEDKLIKILGGYICIRYEEDGNYIDYLADYTDTSTQEVKYSINLLDLETEVKGNSLATCIIPYGAKIESEEETDTEKRVTIESVNNGVDYIQNEEAVSRYGKIYEVVTWDDVTDPSNLLTKAQFYLTEKILLHNSLTVKAVDLNLVDSTIESFKLGDYIRVYSEPHEIDETILLKAYTLDLSKPSTFTFTLGLDRSSLVDINNDRFNSADIKIENTKNELKDYVSSVDKGLTKKIEGIDGTFFYIKYSPYEDGHVMTDQPDENTEYMGTCSTNKTTAPTDYKEYTWVRVKGNDGEDGQPGTNGSSQYFHVKYSNDGKTFTANNGETLGDWMGTCVTETEDDPTDFNTYTWKKIRGEDGTSGIDGVDGQDGESCYFFVKFSANSNGNPMTETPNQNTKYMGTCSTNTNQAPTDYRAYTWTQCRGEDGSDGTNGTPGEPGADGKTSYLHIKYSNDGKTFTGNVISSDPGEWTSGLIPGSGTIDSSIQTTGFGKYASFIEPIQVVPGEKYKFVGGNNYTFNVRQYDSTGNYVSSVARTGDAVFTIPSNIYYIKIMISTNYSNFTEISNALINGDISIALYKGEVIGEELGAYIGTYVDFTEKDSEVFSDYTWKKFTEDVDDELEDIRQTIVEQSTSMTNTCESIILEALKSYTETGNFETFKETVESQLTLLAEQMELKFTQTTEQIENVNGELQNQINTITKYFTFDINGMTIGQSDSPYKVIIDHDRYSMTSNDVEILWIANGKVFTPEIEVTNGLNFFGYSLTEDSNGNVNLDYLGTILPLEIIKHPENQSVEVGNTATFTVMARGSALTYQWQEYRSSTWYNLTTESAKTNTLLYETGSTSQSGRKVRCIITDGNGNTVTSNSATITVS